MKTDHNNVSMRPHYDGDECMRALEGAGWGRSGCLFNVGKYLWRMGRKASAEQDVAKSIWYAERFRDLGYGVLRAHEIETLRMCRQRGLENLDPMTAIGVAPALLHLWNALGIKD